MIAEPAEGLEYDREYAYADPPYLGMCSYYGHRHEEPFGCWDDIDTHRLLIETLETNCDGWALSLSSTTLRPILAICPKDVRVAAWVKPFASFKPGVNPGYCWEPVIFRGARRRTDRTEPTVRDFLAESIALKKGLTGAKPEAFCRWVLNLLGVRHGDLVHDMFPGTGVMSRVLGELQIEWGGHKQ